MLSIRMDVNGKDLGSSFSSVKAATVQVEHILYKEKGHKVGDVSAEIIEDTNKRQVFQFLAGEDVIKVVATA